MKANITPDKKMLERMQDNMLAFYEQWNSLNFAIAFLTTLEYCGFGYKRGNELLDAIVKEFARHDDYGNDNYSIEYVSKELEKRGIDASAVFRSSTNLKDALHRERKSREKKNGISVVQQANVEKDVEKFKVIKNILKGE